MSSEYIEGQGALINLNDEAGIAQFSVELESDVGNWLDSFPSLAKAIAFIRSKGLVFDEATGFRDTRSSSRMFMTDAEIEANWEPSRPILDICLELRNAGDLVGAIRKYRITTGASLKVARELLDNTLLKELVPVDNRVFSYDEVPFNQNPRWFLKRGATTVQGRGFSSQTKASQWIENLGKRLDWRSGFTFRLRSDSVDMSIVNWRGELPGPGTSNVHKTRGEPNDK